MVLTCSRWLLRRLRQICLCSLMAVMLTACSLGHEPPRSIINEALAQQIVITQSAIASSLNLPVSTEVPSVSRVRIEQQEQIKLDGSRLVHLLGSFDWQLPGDSMRVDSAFELFLERGEHGDSWSLARPLASSPGQQQWQLFPLGLEHA